jgi:ATP-dependent DNA ligase
MASLGKATLESQGTFADKNLMGQLLAYRKVVAANYVLTSSADIERKLALPLLVSTKLDGELWFLLHDGEWKLVSPTGRVISGDIEFLGEASKAGLDKSSIFAGELHVLGKARTRVADLSSALGAGEKADTSKIGFAIFDLVSSPALSAIGTPYTTRYEEISKIASSEHLFHAVSTPTKTSSEVAEIFDREITGGGEGLVARAEDGRSFKVKPTKDLDAAIIGFIESREADGSLVVRSLLFGLLNEDGSWIPVTTTGSVGDTAFRKELHQLLAASVKASSYRRISGSSGVMYQLVEPRLIVELKCVDLQLDSASVHNAVVVRLRNDKACTFEDIGWNQITRLIPIAEVSDQIKLGTSEVIRRQVWSKEGSGKVDVRKLLIWKTNKESAGYPAYVVHWTDYSSTRKSPLDREVRLAPNEKEAVKIAEAMIAENIKKGWSEVVK